MPDGITTLVNVEPGQVGRETQTVHVGTMSKLPVTGMDVKWRRN